jgi:hypothetical protein
VVPHVPDASPVQAEQPFYMYGGIFSWRYDAKYKEVRINIDNNDKNTGLKQKKRAKRQKIMITIKEATKSELTDYIKFPFTLYKNNKYWVTIIADELETLTKPKSGF